MDEPITKAEHEEFRNYINSERKRLDAADSRLNDRLIVVEKCSNIAKECQAEIKRLDAEDTRLTERVTTLEEDMKDIKELTGAVKSLATNMEHMAKEQEKQGTRLEKLESRDGENWRKVVWLVVSTLIGAAIGFLLSHIGL